MQNFHRIVHAFWRWVYCQEEWTNKDKIQKGPDDPAKKKKKKNFSHPRINKIIFKNLNTQINKALDIIFK